MYWSGMFCSSKYTIPNKSVIAIDLDGTLAEAEEPYDPTRIGKPIPKMVNLVRKLIKQGKKVVIITARMNTQVHTKRQLIFTRKLIEHWAKKYIGKALPCTAEKHHSMAVIYDDRAIQVIPNTGKIVK